MLDLLNTPVHPLIVHFPIVLLLIAALFAFATLWEPLRKLRPIEFFALAGGVATAWLATETGEESAESFQALISRSPEARLLFERHSTLAEAVVVVFGLLLLMRLVIGGWQLWQHYRELPSWRTDRRRFLAEALTYMQRLPKAAEGVYLVGAVVGVILLVLVGHYGGQLVYVHGVGVAPLVGMP